MSAICFTPFKGRLCMSWTAVLYDYENPADQSETFSLRSARCRFQCSKQGMLQLVPVEGHLSEPFVLTVLVERRDGGKPICQALGCENVGELPWERNFHWSMARFLDYSSMEGHDHSRGLMKYKVRFVFIFEGDTSSVRDDNIEQPIQKEIAKISSDFPPNLENLSLDFANLLKNETLPDVVLKCVGRSSAIPAHRAVLAARSEVFAAMFRNEMAESRSREVDVPDVEDDVMDLFLQYVYSGRIPSGVSDEVVPGLYDAADKYAVHALRETCRERMVKGLTQENCVDFLTVADAHGDAMFKKWVIDYICSDKAVLKGDAWREFSKKQPSLAIEVYDCFVDCKSNVV